MASSTLDIKYRPVRIGFLVREGSIEDLVQVAGINTLLWGGIFNPIIPVGTHDTEYGEHLVKLFPLDVLHPTVSSPAIQQFKEKYKFLDDAAYNEVIFEDDYLEPKKVSRFLDVLNLIHLIFEETMKGKPKSFKSRFSHFTWSKSDPLANGFALQFGYFLDAKEMRFKRDYKTIFQKALRARERPIKAKEKLMKMPGEISPIDLSQFEIESYRHGSRFFSKGIFVGSSNDFYDLLSFWNLRASGCEVIFVDETSGLRLTPFVKTHLDSFKTEKKEEFIPNVVVFHRKEKSKEGDIEKFLKRLGIKKPITFHELTPASWDGSQIRANDHLFEEAAALVDIDQSKDRTILNVKLPEKKFLKRPAYEEIDRQRVAVSFHTFSEFEYKGSTIQPPYIPELNEHFSREIAFHPCKMKIEGGGSIRLQMDWSDNFLRLYPVLCEKVAKEVIKNFGFTVKDNQAGLLSKKLIEKINGIDGARFLKIKGVRELFKEKGKDHVVNRSAAIQLIRENDFKKHEHLYIEQREAKKLTPDQVFSFLLKNDFFRAGLVLKCQECNLDSWLSLKQIDDLWTCEYCGFLNKISTQLGTRGDWTFRKNGFFSQESKRQGAIPVILTLWVFSKIANFSKSIYTTAVNLKNDVVKCEIDFCWIQYERVGSSGAMQIAFGECKSDGGEIDQKDCENLVKVYEEIRKDRRFEPFIVFSKTSDAFSVAEVKLFKDLQSRGVRLILFTNQELEPYDTYWDTKEDLNKHPFSLSDLSHNSIKRYLSK